MYCNLLQGSWISGNHYSPDLIFYDFPPPHLFHSSLTYHLTIPFFTQSILLHQHLWTYFSLCFEYLLSSIFWSNTTFTLSPSLTSIYKIISYLTAPFECLNYSLANVFICFFSSWDFKCHEGENFVLFNAISTKQSPDFF